MNFNDFYLKGYGWVLLYGPRLLAALVLLVAGFWLVRKMKKWISLSLGKKEVDPSLRPFLISFSGIILQVLLLVSVMQVLGIEMTVFATVVGAFGVAAGLALSGTLQNFTSGILILLLKPFKVGDIIIAQGQEGVVSSIQIFYTLVTTFDNRTVVLPNSKLSNEVIVNLSREGLRRLDVEFKLSYTIPFQQVKVTIEKTIELDRSLLKLPEHRIGVSSVDGDGYKVMVNTWVNAHDYQEMKLHFQEKLIDDLKSAGIKLPGM